MTTRCVALALAFGIVSVSCLVGTWAVLENFTAPHVALAILLGCFSLATGSTSFKKFRSLARGRKMAAALAVDSSEPSVAVAHVTP